MTSINNRRGIFLDLDGTLADSASVLQWVYEKFLNRYNCIANTNEFMALNGPPLVEVVKRLKETHHLREDVDSLVRIYQSLIKESYNAVQPAIGAHELLSSSREHGWITGVVTSNNRDLTMAWLERAGLNKWIDLVVAAEDISEGKPSPDPYLKALHLGKVAAELSFGIEDSSQGAQSASSAGLQTIVVTKSPKEERQWPPRPIFVSQLSEIMEIIFDD